MANGDIGVENEPFSMASGTDYDPNAVDPPPRDPLTNQPQSSDESSTATGDTHKDEEYTQRLQNQAQTDAYRSDQHAMDQQQNINYINQMIQDLNSTPLPQQQQLLPPPTQEDKTKATQNLLQLVAIAGIAFSVFGSRRNPYAQGALMGGMGALLQGYAQGRTERQKEALINWHQLNEKIHKENAQRLEEYKEIRDNKKLNLEEQFKLFAMKGQAYGSRRMDINAQKGDWKAIQQHITHMENAQRAHAVQTPKETTDEKNYWQIVKDQSGFDYHTPEGQPQAIDWASKNYPYSQYLEEKGTRITTDEAGNVKSITRPGFPGKESTAPKGSLDEAMDKTYGKKKGGIDPKAKSSTTTTPSDKNDTSVLSPATPSRLPGSTTRKTTEQGPFKYFPFFGSESYEQKAVREIVGDDDGTGLGGN